MSPSDDGLVDGERVRLTEPTETVPRPDSTPPPTKESTGDGSGVSISSSLTRFFSWLTKDSYQTFCGLSPVLVPVEPGPSEGASRRVLRFRRTTERLGGSRPGWLTESESVGSEILGKRPHEFLVHNRGPRTRCRFGTSSRSGLILTTVSVRTLSSPSFPR